MVKQLSGDNVFSYKSPPGDLPQWHRTIKLHDICYSPTVIIYHLWTLKASLVHVTFAPPLGPYFLHISPTIPPCLPQVGSVGQTIDRCIIMGLTVIQTIDNRGGRNWKHLWLVGQIEFTVCCSIHTSIYSVQLTLQYCFALASILEHKNNLYSSRICRQMSLQWKKKKWCRRDSNLGAQLGRHWA